LFLNLIRISSFFFTLIKFTFLSRYLGLSVYNSWTYVQILEKISGLYSQAYLFSCKLFSPVSLIWYPSYFIGGLVDRLSARKRFLWFYLASGIFASIFFALLSGFFGLEILEKIFGDPSIPGVGASGAIFGLSESWLF